MKATTAEMIRSARADKQRNRGIRELIVIAKRNAQLERQGRIRFTSRGWIRIKP